MIFYWDPVTLLTNDWFWDCSYVFILLPELTEHSLQTFLWRTRWYACSHQSLFPGFIPHDSNLRGKVKFRNLAGNLVVWASQSSRIKEDNGHDSWLFEGRILIRHLIFRCLLWRRRTRSFPAHKSVIQLGCLFLLLCLIPFAIISCSCLTSSSMSSSSSSLLPPREQTLGSKGQLHLQSSPTKTTQTTCNVNLFGRSSVTVYHYYANLIYLWRWYGLQKQSLMST